MSQDDRGSHSFQPLEYELCFMKKTYLYSSILQPCQYFRQSHISYRTTTDSKLHGCPWVGNRQPSIIQLSCKEKEKNRKERKGKKRKSKVEKREKRERLYVDILH